MLTCPSRRLVVAASTIFCAASHSAHAQQFAYLTTLGKDTLALEQYVRSGSTIVGDYATVYKNILIHHYVIHVATTGTIDRLQLTVGRRGSEPFDTLRFTGLGDSANVYSSRWPERSRVVRAPNLFPMFVGANAFEETAVSYARSRRSDSLTIPIVAVWANFDTAHFRVLMYAPDSIGLWSRVTPGILKLDGQGHVVAANARLTSTRTETLRVPPFDLGQVLQSMRDSPREDSSTDFPVLSPRDSASGIVGSTRVEISYGRPSLRGRDVFVHGVLGDTIWRTGANQGTEFATRSDILVGDRRLPAGRYILWTRTTADNARYSLILSGATGRGCLDYKSSRDVLEVPLTVDRIDTSVDRLTLAVDYVQVDESRLAISWGRTRLSVPLRPAPSGGTH